MDLEISVAKPWAASVGWRPHSRPFLVLLPQFRDHGHGGFVQLSRMNSAYKDGHTEPAREVEADKTAETRGTSVVPVERAFIGLT